MVRRERDVVARMPVLRQHHIGEFLAIRFTSGTTFVAAGNGERPARCRNRSAHRSPAARHWRLHDRPLLRSLRPTQLYWIYASAGTGAAVSPATGRARCSAGFSAWLRLNAVLTSATCVKACGKLPTRRPARGSYSSAQQADVVAQREQALEQRARVLPAAAAGCRRRPARSCRRGTRPRPAAGRRRCARVS